MKDFNEYDVVKLISDFEELKKDTMGTILYVYDNEIVEVEFVDKLGKSLGTKTINLSNLSLF